MPINAHRVFDSSNEASYLKALNIDSKREDALRAAREDVRECIRQGFAQWGNVITKGILFESLAPITPDRLRPKFRMQGSFSYRTLNDPAQTPPQQIDLDDGVFLPVSFFQNSGALTPAIASTGYFHLTEKLLKPLCDKRGWELITDKSSCVRIQFDTKSHMDLALYSIPEADFAQLINENVQKAELASAMDGKDFYDSVYKAIPSDHIMLAHRDKGWMKSDPRKLEVWFHDSLDTYGEQYRSVCRYLKGWRDFQWEECKLTSIILMACVRKVYDAGYLKMHKMRDDLAVATVAKYLPNLLNTHIANPVVPGVNLDEWKPEQRAEYVRKAQELSNVVNNAINGESAQDALKELRSIFGERIPNEVSFIDEGKSPAVQSGIIRNLGEDPSVKGAVKLGSDQRYGYHASSD